MAHNCRLLSLLLCPPRTLLYPQEPGFAEVLPNQPRRWTGWCWGLLQMALERSKWARASTHQWTHCSQAELR